MKKTITLILILIAFRFFPFTVHAQESFDIKVYLDTKSSGWAYKDFDYAFLIELEDCKIKWNVIKEKNGGMWLEVHRDCNGSFSKQSKLHKAILNEINNRWKLKGFKYVLWGSFCEGNDWNFCIPVALASLHSTEFIDYCKNYPNSKLKSLNALFVKFAKETNAYAELSALFRAFGVNLYLNGVEKVFSAKIRDTPFYHELDELHLERNPRVMYNAGMSYFDIREMDHGT